MTELQEKVLSLVMEIDEVCRRNDIEYYLAAGTALGAIRHHGFLPWDDDADIYMTADNWKKLLAVKDQIPDGRQIVTVDEGDYSSEYTINRYVDVTTTRIYRYLSTSPQPAGITVDIIILDPVPNDKDLIREHIIDLTEYGNYLCMATPHAHRCPYPTRDKEIWEEGEKIGRDAMLDKLKARNERFPATEDGMLVQRDPVVPHVWSAKVFGKPQYVKYENVELPVASRPYLQLTGAFNEDWMYVPDVIDRQEHIKGIIYGISSNNPLDDFFSRVDNEKVRSTSVEITSGMNFCGETIKEYKRNKLMVSALKVRMLYGRKGFDKNEMLKALKERDHDTLDQYFQDYEIIQCHKELTGGVAIPGWLMSQDPYYIDISDEFLYVFLRNLMHRPMLGKSRVILAGRLNSGKSSELTDELSYLINKCNELTDMVESADCSGALKELEQLYRKYPENLRLMQLYFACRWFLLDKNDSNAAVELEKEMTGLPECDFNESVVSCIYAELLSITGRKTQALDIYRRLAGESSHGLVLNFIKEKFENAEPETEEKYIEMLASYKLGAPIELPEDDEDEDDDEDDQKSDSDDGDDQQDE